MNAIRVLAIVLLVAGGLALAYGGFTYTKNTQKAKVGSMELSVKESETVNIPVWAGVLSMVVGAVLLISRK
jgi:TRAP-type C4-dicarboxylate transport system permease small subunit